MKMKNLIFCLLILAGSFNSFAQNAMTFQEAERNGKPFAELDKTYKSAVHSNTDLAVFKTEAQQQQLQKAYIGLLQDLGRFLKANQFSWEKEIRCFNRIYLNSDGTIDYFLYHFASGQIAAQKEQEFGRLLNLFVADYQFSLTADEKFAQCSPVKYSD